MGIMKKRKLQKNHYKKKKGEQEENRNRKIDWRIRIGDIVVRILIWMFKD